VGGLNEKGVKLVRHKGNKPKYLPKMNEKPVEMPVCIHNCKECVYAFPESFGNLYWCSLKQCRVDENGSPVKSVDEVMLK